MSHPEITIKQSIYDLNLKPNDEISFYLEGQGFVKIHLTNNGKFIVLNKEVDVVVKSWEGHRKYKKFINDIEDEEYENE